MLYILADGAHCDAGVAVRGVRTVGTMSKRRRQPREAGKPPAEKKSIFFFNHLRLAIPSAC